MVFVALSSPTMPAVYFALREIEDGRADRGAPVRRGRSAPSARSPVGDKAPRFAILLVDIGGQRGMKRKRAFHQCLADAFAVVVRIDEKRLHMPFMQKHEAEGMICSIDGEHQRYLRQESSDFLTDRGAIRRKEEAMGGIDGPAPYVEDAGRVAAVGGTKCYHAHP